MAALHALVIDDHEAVREEVRENLDSLGHTCAMAGSREEALTCLGAAVFDYVLLDLEIPTRFGRPTLLATGHALLDDIRKAHPAIPIIVISAKDDDRHLLGMEVLRLNRATDFVRKPFPDPGQGRTLTQTISEVLATRSRLHGATSAAKPARKFTGGELVFYRDRVTLERVRIAYEAEDTLFRRILEALAVKDEEDRFVRFTGAELVDAVGVETSEKTINGRIRDLRNHITAVMDQEGGLTVHAQDVIETGRGGQKGYRLAAHIRFRVVDADWLPPSPDCPEATAVPPTLAPKGGNGTQTSASLAPNGTQSAAKDPLEGLAKEQRELAQALAGGQTFTNAAIQERWGIKDRTVSRWMAALRDLGLAEFVGPSRTGCWQAKRATTLPPAAPAGAAGAAPVVPGRGSRPR